MPRFTKKRSRNDDGSDDAPAPQKSSTSKKPKTATTAAAAAKDGTPTWELGNKRRAQISKFNDKFFVNIREFYEKDGDLLPGKKGIALSPEMWQALVSAMPAINAGLLKKGITIEAPEAVDEKEKSDVQMTSGEDEPLAKPSPTKPKKGKKSEKKSNIDATSDEEEDED